MAFFMLKEKQFAVKIWLVIVLNCNFELFYKLTTFCKHLHKIYKTDS